MSQPQSEESETILTSFVLDHAKRGDYYYKNDLSSLNAEDRKIVFESANVLGKAMRIEGQMVHLIIPHQTNLWAWKQICADRNIKTVYSWQVMSRDSIGFGKIPELKNEMPVSQK